MCLYHVQMLYQKQIKTKLLDYILGFTLTVLFTKLKYTNIVQKQIFITTRARTFISKIIIIIIRF